MQTSTRHTRRLALVLPLLAAAGGCATWSRQSTSARQARYETYAGTVRVTRTNGESIVLDRVTVGVDSVVGLDHGSRTRVAIPASDVRRLESRRVEPVRTAGLVVLAAAAAVGAVFALGVHSQCGCVQ